MKRDDRRAAGRRARPAGFSLIEVNMAIFVIAVGILAMVSLYPLGLRESMLGTADLKQSSLADHFLNQIVAAASMTNFPYSQFKNIPRAGVNGVQDNPGSGLPAFIRGKMRDEKGNGFSENDKRFKIVCRRMPGSEERLMGVWVRCTELDYLGGYGDYSRNPLYYAEVYFTGDPEK